MSHDTSHARPRWADVIDSSQENENCLQPPLSQESYRELSQPSQNSRTGTSACELHRQCATALTVTGDVTQLGEVSDPKVLSRTSTLGPNVIPCPVGDSSPDSRLPLAEIISSPGSMVGKLAMDVPGCAVAATMHHIKPGTGRSGTPPRMGWTPHVLERAAVAAAVATPIRHRNVQKRLGDLRSQTPIGKRLRSAPESTRPFMEPSEEDWHRRNEKRHKAVAAIKMTPEYQSVMKKRMLEMPGGVVAAPRTPDPNDSSLSKRRWEADIMQWRSSLRQCCGDNNQELFQSNS